MEWLEKVRWRPVFKCPACGSDGAIQVEPGLRRCLSCRRRVSVLSGTPFHRHRVTAQQIRVPAHHPPGRHLVSLRYVFANGLVAGEQAYLTIRHESQPATTARQIRPMKNVISSRVIGRGLSLSGGRPSQFRQGTLDTPNIHRAWTRRRYFANPALTFSRRPSSCLQPALGSQGDMRFAIKLYKGASPSACALQLLGEIIGLDTVVRGKLGATFCAFDLRVEVGQAGVGLSDLLR